MKNNFNPKDIKVMPQVRSTPYFIWEVVKIVIISLAIIIPIRFFLIQPFFVRGASMEPTYHDGEYLIIDEISYRLHEPQRGDVIVFRYPKDPSQYYIKRIVGLPGEKVEIKDDKVIIYNKEHASGIIVNEKEYLDYRQYTSGDVNMILKDNEYFVLGDNRAASSDSRSWGAVNRNEIIGKVWIRVWPFEKFKVFTQPNYEFSY